MIIIAVLLAILMGLIFSATLRTVLISSVTPGTTGKIGLIGLTGKTPPPSTPPYLMVQVSFGTVIILWSNVRMVTRLRHTLLKICFTDWSQAALSTAAVVHADYGYSGYPRRVPQFLARGPFNDWGFDKGLANQMTQNSEGKWELEIMAQWPTYVQLNGE